MVVGLAHLGVRRGEVSSFQIESCRIAAKDNRRRLAKTDGHQIPNEASASHNRARKSRAILTIPVSSSTRGLATRLFPRKDCALLAESHE